MVASSFTARRTKPELVTPARATPRETKPLSDLDDSRSLRFLEPGVEFFSPIEEKKRDPVEAVRAALAEALVHYYPIAGRMRELEKGKLVVDCTGEGVVFVEADADVRLVELGEPPVPPFPCAEEFLCDVGDGWDVIGRPLFFMQVTRLKCGGFVIGSHICHNIADGFGTILFLKAIADIVRGEVEPTILPVWERELLMARIPPCINTLSEEFSRAKDDDIMWTTPTESMVCEYFTFSPSNIAALRRLVRAKITNVVTSFELLTVAMWRSRTVALGYQSSDKVRLMFTMNARGRLTKLPKGYYGNAILSPVVETTVTELCEGSFEHTIGLVQKAKHEMLEEENMQSMVDLMALLRERPPHPIDRLYISSDIKWIGQTELDFGWAKRIGGGLPAIGDKSSKIVSDHSMYKDDKGERMIVVSMLLPRTAMDIFKKDIAVYLNEKNSK